VSYGGGSNMFYPFIKANAATLCVSGTYFAVANGTVIFPPGYWPVGGHIEQISRQVGIRCDAPSFLTLTESAARAAVQQFGAVVGTVTTQPSSARIGTVAAQSPPPGTPLGRGEAVSLVLSSGDAVVPSVYGLSKRDAISAVESAGLVPSVHSEEHCIDPQSVISQNPDPGTRKNRGDRVSIFYDSSTRSGCGIIK
jgi:hypothetical protein